jgi:hypothetical protein
MLELGFDAAESMRDSTLTYPELLRELRLSMPVETSLQ